MQGKNQEIKWLKDERANITEETIWASKVQKVEPNSQLQHTNAKITRLEAKYSRQAPLIKVIQEESTSTRSKAHQWREVAQQRTASLSNLQEKEKKGLTQIAKICEEKDRAMDKLNEFQAMINYYQ